MAATLPINSVWTRKTTRLCCLSSRRPGVVLSCQLVVASPLVVLSLPRPLIVLSRQLVVASPLTILSLHCPLVVLSCQQVVAQLVAPACCPITSPRPLVAPRTALSFSRCAGRLLHCLSTRRPLVISSSCRLVVPSLVVSSCQLVVAPSSLVILSLHRTLVLSSCWLVVVVPVLAPPSRPIVLFHHRRHRTPLSAAAAIKHHSHRHH